MFDIKKYKHDWYIENKKRILKLRKQYRIENIVKITKYEKLRPRNIPYQGRLYRTWRRIKVRCYVVGGSHYKYYGARGIIVCKEWKDNFKQFEKDMKKSFEVHVKKYGLKQTTIDRIDVNGNYCKENCRWATHKVQQNNKRKRVL